jgi:serine phosphatase RsbU (regulator of sigma subunit)
MASNQTTILVISDDEAEVSRLRGLLDYRWDGSFRLFQVEDVDTALRLAKEKRADVILLDLALEHTGGLASFLKVYGRLPETPIVVLSGTDDESLAMKAVQAGAQDYLVKTSLSEQLLVRSLRYAIERARREQAEESLRMTSAKFRVARDIQRRLFPARSPQIEAIDVAGTSIPADETGGDFFDYIPLADGSLAVAIADVSGHGLGAALLMAQTRAYLRALAMNHDDVGQIVSLANRVLIEDTQGRHFVTLLLGRLDPATKSLTYAGAGHSGYLVDPDCGGRLLESTGLPLGVEDELVVPCAGPISLAPGHVVLFCTDGIPEAQAPDGEMFGMSRALEVVRANAQRSAGEIIAILCDAVQRHTAGKPQGDDITVVAIKVC